MAAEKAAWRRRFRELRNAVPSDALARASAAIADAVVQLPEVQVAGCIHLFWPLDGRGEIDLRGLAATLSGRGVRVGLPVVYTASPPVLRHRLFTGPDGLADGPWGLREPGPDAPTLLPGTIDVVVVPALGLDRRGHRLGYGGGFYDAFLPQTPALRVGVVLDAALVDALPVDAADARMDVIVTEKAAIRTGRTGRLTDAAAL